MITLLLAMCQLEVKEVDLRYAVITHLPKAQQTRSAEDLWVENCVMRKGMGL